MESYKIAVIEDEKTQQVMIKGQLERTFSHEVDIFSSGEEFISYFKGNPKRYDVILMDYQLNGGMTGYDTYKEVFKINRDVPCVLVTAYGSAHLVNIFHKVGGVDFIPKPIDDWHNLNYRIASLIKNRKDQLRLREMVKKTTTLEEQKKVSDAFLKTVSHDLRNPIQVVIGNIEHALHEGYFDYKGGDEIRNSLKIASSYAERLNGIVGAILDMAVNGVEIRMERLQTIDLGYLLRSFVEDVTKNYLHGEASVELDVIGECLAVVEPDKMFIVLLNIIDNAIKYSHDNKSIKIICFERGEDDNHVDILISDNGVGVSLEDLPYVFDQFVRLDKSSTIAGTGLGLHTSKMLVESMGGKIWVRSRENDGSTFGITLKKIL